MKVQQAEITFHPITITLETKEEATLIYNLLNCPMDYRARDGALAQGVTDPAQLQERIWAALYAEWTIDGVRS